MTNFYMMVGLPGSGKTVFAHNIEKGAVVISSDKIREELWGSEESQGDNRIVFKELEKRVIQNLKEGKSVVYDATNIKSKKRRDFLYKLRNIPGIKKMCVFMNVPYELCIKQNNERGRVVPEEVIERMYVNFQVPQEREGWDEINIIQPKLEGYDVFNEMDRLCKVQSIYGDLSIGGHCINATKYLTDNYSLKLGVQELVIMQLAAFLQDIGEDFKPMSKKNERSHYENISAYKSLLYLCKDKSLDKVEEVLYVADIIALRMSLFDSSEEDKVKLKKLVGEKEYRDLEILNESDISTR